MNHQSLIKWLRECYRDDHTRGGIQDILVFRMENRLFVEGEDKLACGFIDEEILTPAYAKALAGNLLLYKREKEYLYGCLCFNGDIGGKQYRAPLLFYPAEAINIDDDSVATTVKIDHGFYRLNYTLLDALDNKQEIEEGVLGVLEGYNGVLSGLTVAEIAEVFREYMPEVNVDSLVEWPCVYGYKTTQYMSGKKSHIEPIAGFVVVKRSKESSGVVDELADLGDLEEVYWSAALKTVLEGEMNVGKSDYGELLVKSKKKPVLAPVLLSENQQHLLHSARDNTLTVCHGPPGTGKSFTLSAIAIDHIARGETVLIVSKKDHAVDVLSEKVQKMLNSKVAIVRAGRSGYLKQLTDKVSMILSSRYPSAEEAKHSLSVTVGKMMEVLDEIEIEGQQLREEYSKSLARGEVYAKSNPRWYERILKLWYESRVKGRPLLLELTRHLGKLYQNKERVIRALISDQQAYQLNKVMGNASSRKDLKQLAKALKKRKSSEQLKAFSDANFESVLDVFPIWISNLNDLHRVLPPDKELFDVVIIDEASQCDLASALPAIQRAKRVVIAGDAKQLRHVSFMAKSSMEKYARELGMDGEVLENYNYRDVSLMDLAIENTRDASQVALLNEHFRSLKQIIEFSNTQFYQGELLLMRDRPWEKVPERVLKFQLCDGEGNERKSGVNKAEIEAIIKELANLLEAEVTELAPYKSIGILSPFRAQVEVLKKEVNKFALANEYSYRLGKHQLKIGTAHSFQGEERDVMLISMALGRSDKVGAVRFVEQENVFNVSITRAKNEQIIYHSIEPQDLPSGSLLADYIALGGKSSVKQFSETEVNELDLFTKDFVSVFEMKGAKCSVHEQVASISVDVLLELNEIYLGIDLVGYPGYTEEAVGINKHQILERAGMRLVPVGYIEWQVQRENVIEAVYKLLNEF